MIFLSAIGCLFVYSASSYGAKITYGDECFFLKKQLMGVAVGLVCYVFFSLLNYHFFKKKLVGIFFAISVVLLALVFVPGIGLTNYGATRWINLRFITFQPSEIAKFSFIILSANLLAKSAEKVKSFKGILPILLIGATYCVLIILEPNMSITICMALLVVVMLLMGGAKFKHFAMLSVPAAIMVVVLILIEPYRLKRLIAFIDPFAANKMRAFSLCNRS